MRLQLFERNKLERGRVTRFQVNRPGPTALERSFPARDADAPSIARLQAGKTPFRVGRDKIVPIENGKVQKLPRHLYAYGVLANVLGAGATITIAIKARERIAAATFQCRSENVGARTFLCCSWIFRHMILNHSLVR